MIILPAQSKTHALQYPTTNGSDEMYEWLDRAVEAYAADKDVLNRLLGVDTFDSTLQLMSAVDWLVDRAPFDMALISTNREARRYFNLKLNGDPRSVWMFNIHTLAMELLRRNYDQGWEEGNRHPVFSLRFPSVYDASEDNIPYFELSSLDRERHWPLFVQAVMAHEWLVRSQLKRADDANERAIAFEVGAVNLLATSYPILGEPDSEGLYSRKSFKPSVATDFWQKNVEAASAAFARSQGYISVK